jgi:protein ImuB
MEIKETERRRDGETKRLHELARRMMRFSPVVAVEPPDAIALDVTGSQLLFRGMDRLLRLASAACSAALSGWRLTHGIAIAPTLGAAWALASFDSGRIISSVEELAGVLRPLPVAALRLDETSAHALCGLGIATIGQLAALPRQTLPARFGPAILTRLDQAVGRMPEPLTALCHQEKITAQMRFDDAIESPEMLLEIFRRLLEQVLDALRRRGCGARILMVDYLCRAAPISKTISLSRPTRDASALLNLLRCATETISVKAQGTSSLGVFGLRLSVPIFERLPDEQLQLLEEEGTKARRHGGTKGEEAELDHLFERLRIRLGGQNVLFPQLLQSHLPEQSFHYASSSQPLVLSPQSCIPPRPLHLLPTPIEIRCIASPSEEPCSFTLSEGGAWRSEGGAWRSEGGAWSKSSVFQIAHCTGPERICGDWWTGRDKTRDYFEVEESGGRRFWIFRVAETSGRQSLRRRWFLHGLFD